MLLVLPACKGFTEGFNKEFKTSFVREFKASCVKSAVASGAPEARARTGCDCMADYFGEHYTPAELAQLSASAESVQSKQMIKAATKACHLDKH